MFIDSLTGKSGGRDFDYPIGRGLSVRLGLHESWLNASCSSWKLVPALANVDGPDSDYALCAWLCVCALGYLSCMSMRPGLRGN